MTEAQKKKRKFRNCKAWKSFCHKKNVEQKGLDVITQTKLRKFANCHHLDMNEKHYTDISNAENFCVLNLNTHKFIHWIYEYYKNDSGILDRIKLVLDKMVALNEEV